MEEENEAILVAMIIGAVILGIGLALFFNRPFTGFGAVVLAIGLMTLSLIITMRAEEIIHLKIYPTASSENVAKVSVETPSSMETALSSVQETQAQGVSEGKEEPGTQETSETQGPQETGQSQPQSMYKPTPTSPQETETTTAQPQTPYETSFEQHEQEQECTLEPEQEPEASTEAPQPSSEQNRETEEPEESTTTVITTS